MPSKIQYWLKLNIYSMLLTFLLILAVGLRNNIGILQDALWKNIVFWTAWAIIALQTLKIYGRFPYKLDMLHRLVRQGTKHYDRRLFYPYMGSPCMRSVVYFSLCELGRQGDYRQIRKNFFAKADEVTEEEPARQIRMIYENGVLKFSAYDQDSEKWDEFD